MKKAFFKLLIIINTFLVSYAYGLNSQRVQVIDHTLPALVTKKAETEKPPTGKPAGKSAAQAAAKTGANTGSSATTKPQAQAKTPATTTKHGHSKHAAHAAKKSDT